jgi:hypothetical protein
MLPGTVVNVASSVTKRSRTSTYVTCDFILNQDATKRKTLNIRSIKAGPPTEAVPFPERMLESQQQLL